MKVSYEFNYQTGDEDFYNLQVFQKAHAMLHAINKIEDYLRQVNKGYIKDDLEDVIDYVFDVIFEHNIGEIE